MTHHVSVLDAAREAYRRRQWIAARDGFDEARAAGAMLGSDDLFQLSDAAWWIGDVETHLSVAEAAYHAFLDEERQADAVMAGMGIAISHFLRGDEPLGSGWLGRCLRLLGGEDGDTREHGYALFVLRVESQYGGVDSDEVIEAAQRVQAIGRRHADPNLVAAGAMGEGRVRIQRGEVAAGLALLDEAMVAATSDELSPEWAGLIYCNLMIACTELADYARAARWTDATERWLQTMPVAVLFRGICRVHRSQLHQLRGAWELAEGEALRVCEQLADIAREVVAEAWYRVAEVRRLRGDLAESEAAYRAAHGLGRDPQPGLALLRLAQGRVAIAAASVEAALVARPSQRLARAPLLSAQVEIAIAAGDARLARRAADELASIAVAFGSAGLLAASHAATGCALLAERSPAGALHELRAAARAWQALAAPYETAVVRQHLARAYDALGDRDAAHLERTAAAAALSELGAPAGEAVAAAARPDGLSARELEVLSLVAGGRTNRQIADALVISEKTVARHLSNIYTKLDLSSRTEAAAYAFRQGLAAPG